MKHKLLFTALVLAGISLSSCKKDDDKDKRSDDPRILRMTLSEYPEATFIVNDYNGVIYNYDSLPFGSQLNLHPRFTGHSAITVFYDSLGSWATYSNDTSIKLNCNGDVVRAVSENQAFYKDYKIELRVHKYDVDAFAWNKAASLPAKSDLKSFNTLKIGDEIAFFCSAEGSNFAYTSKDASAWTEKAVSVEANEAINWRSLCIAGDKAYVLSDGSDVFVANLPSFDFKKTDLRASEILFNIDGNIWTISETNGSKAACMIDTASNSFTTTKTLPSAFPTEHIKTIACKSGNTTLGYVYGIKDNVSCLWAIDSKGNLMELAKPGSSLPVRKDFEFCFFQKRLGLVGGFDENGKYSNKYYYTKNSGLDWLRDWHKDLPDEMGEISNFDIVNLSDNEIIVSGGQTANGFSATVWKGTIRSVLLNSEK